MKSVRNENPIETNSDPIFMSENGLVVLEIRVRGIDFEWPSGSGPKSRVSIHGFKIRVTPYLTF